MKHHMHRGRHAGDPERGARGGGGRDFGHRPLGARDETGGRGGRGRRRVFENGELRLVLLRLMEDGPRHGYDLIRAFEARTNGAYAPSPGVIYPTLALLEDLGQVEAQETDGAKKRFAVTPAGQEHLAARRAEADTALGRLDLLARGSQAIDEGPVFRAMTNLKAALRQRLAGEPDKTLLFSVADALDEAARKIERL